MTTSSILQVDKLFIVGIAGMVSMILAMLTTFVIFVFLPILNSSESLSPPARNIIEDVFPIILILVPLFTILGAIILSVRVFKDT